jgi:hypothetical protein
VQLVGVLFGGLLGYRGGLWRRSADHIACTEPDNRVSRPRRLSERRSPVVPFGATSAIPWIEGDGPK